MADLDSHILKHLLHAHLIPVFRTTITCLLPSPEIKPNCTNQTLLYHSWNLPMSRNQSYSNFNFCECIYYKFIGNILYKVFWPHIYFTPLVLRLRGQVGHQTKWNSSRNWLFLVLSATFHQKLNNLQKCPKISKKCQFWVFFKSFLNIGWKVAHETISIQFLEDFCFFWCPTWSVSHETIGDISGFTLCFEI